MMSVTIGQCAHTCIIIHHATTRATVSCRMDLSVADAPVQMPQAGVGEDHHVLDLDRQLIKQHDVGIVVHPEDELWVVQNDLTDLKIQAKSSEYTETPFTMICKGAVEVAPMLSPLRCP